MRWTPLLLLAVVAAIHGEETCLSSEENPYLLFGTKTSYIFANPRVSTTKVHEVLGCQPVAFWLLNRHGSHSPEADEIKDLHTLIDLKTNIIGNYRVDNFRKNNNQRICPADLNLLQLWEWNPRHNLSLAGEITSDGYIATQTLAQAWKQRYPGILTENKHDYLFKFVNDYRSSMTFQAFTKGLFKAQAAEELDIPKENDEKLLRPYKFCPAWTKDVEENNNTLSQLFIFESKWEYKEMITNISQRLGFSYDIDKATIKRIYQMCRYNKAWNVALISPWCAAFTREDIRRLEYGEDLETYYKYGYGTEMNQKIGCTLVKDMMNFFKIHIEHNVPQQPRAMIHFTEAPMVMMMMAALGGRHDAVPLTGNNYHTGPVQSRKWVSSVISPFNANIAAVLYRCNLNGNFQIKDQYQVLFLENEREMYLEGCRVGLCDWSYVKNKFGDAVDKCDLNFCNSAFRFNGITGFGMIIVAFVARWISV